LGKFIVDVATGEVEDREPPPSRAAEHGRVGGLKRAAGLTPTQRAAIAKKAAKTRWRKGRAARAKKEHA
jgi:hypothetical protein